MRVELKLPEGTEGYQFLFELERIYKLSLCRVFLEEIVVQLVAGYAALNVAVADTIAIGIIAAPEIFIGPGEE